MSRDPARNLYITVGIPRDSQLYERLTEETMETGLAHSQVIVMRLADYYRLTRTLSPLPPPLDRQRSVDEASEALPSTDLSQRAAQAAAAWVFDD